MALTLEDFLDRSGAGESSIRTYRYQLGQCESWLGKPLADATERDLAALKTTRLRKIASGRQYCVLLRMFYKVLGREDLRALCVIKQRQKRLSPDDILTLPEVQRMIDTAGSARDKAFLACLWETGVRIHELVAVNLAHVKEKPENGGRVYVMWFGKTKVSGEEHAGYVIEAAPVLQAWLKAHPSPRPDAPLFTTFIGKRLTVNGGRHIVKSIAKRAGVMKRVYPHLFRHSRATHLLRLQVPELQVKKLLGWKPGSPMLARYAHLVDRDAYAALLRAHGYEVEQVDLGRLAFTEDELRAVVPMVPPPGALGHVKSWESMTVEDQARLIAKSIVEDQAKRPRPWWDTDEYHTTLDDLKKLRQDLREELQAIRSHGGKGR